MKILIAMLALGPLLLSGCASTGGMPAAKKRAAGSMFAKPGGDISCPDGLIPSNGQCVYPSTK